MRVFFSIILNIGLHGDPNLGGVAIGTYCGRAFFARSCHTISSCIDPVDVAC